MQAPRYREGPIELSTNYRPGVAVRDNSSSTQISSATGAVDAHALNVGVLWPVGMLLLFVR